MLTDGELRDHPGWWKIDGRIEGESESWSFVRKPDGTFWEVAGVHIFPPGGPLVRIDIGDQIRKPETIARCEGHYAQFQKKSAEPKKEATAAK
jgi:hypothetical protein